MGLINYNINLRDVNLNNGIGYCMLTTMHETTRRSKIFTKYDVKIRNKRDNFARYRNGRLHQNYPTNIT